jgi:hypothetical protein
MYQSWWLAEELPETWRVVIPIKLEFGASVGFINKESVTMHGHTIVKFWTNLNIRVSQKIILQCTYFGLFLSSSDKNSWHSVNSSPLLLQKVYGENWCIYRTVGCVCVHLLISVLSLVITHRVTTVCVHLLISVLVSCYQPSCHNCLCTPCWYQSLSLVITHRVTTVSISR